MKEILYSVAGITLPTFTVIAYYPSLSVGEIFAIALLFACSHILGFIDGASD